jgi:hypothetical protein
MLVRPSEVLAMLRDLGITPQALGFDSHGAPRHPLMLSAGATLVPIPSC